jgi:hypothetical protein
VFCALENMVVMFGIKLKLMKCRFELTYFNNLVTFLKTITAKVHVVMFGIKLKLMKCRFELTYSNGLLTYLKTTRAKVVMLGIIIIIIIILFGRRTLYCPVGLLV